MRTTIPMESSNFVAGIAKRKCIKAYGVSRSLEGLFDKRNPIKAYGVSRSLELSKRKRIKEKKQKKITKKAMPCHAFRLS